MGPTVVRLRHRDAPVRLRAVGLTQPHPVIALAGTTAELSPALAAGLAPMFRTLLRAAADHDAVVVTGGTDAGIFHLLGTSVNGIRPAPRLVGVAPAGCVAPAGGTDHRPGLEPHHQHAVLPPGSAWGDETAVLSRLVTVISGAGRGDAVCVLAGGGDVTRGELRAHLARGRPVVVLRGSGRLADEVAGDGLRDDPDSDLASLVALGDIRVVELADGHTALRAVLDELLGHPRPHDLRTRVPALLAWPRLRVRPAAVDPPLTGEPVDAYPDLAEIRDEADRIVLPALRECDAAAQREQNRHRWYTVLGLLGAFTTTTLGAVQSWLTSTAWPGVAVATAGAATSGLLTIARRQGALDGYVTARTRAEQLRGLYFEHLAAGPGPAEARVRRARLLGEAVRRRSGLSPAPPPAPAAAGPTVARTNGPGWAAQFLDLYRRHRLADQATWYDRRAAQYESALRTTIAVSAALLVLAAFFGALGSADAAGRTRWAVCATACAALAALVSAYEATAGFGELSRHYRDTVAVLRLAEARAESVEDPDPGWLTAFVTRTEGILGSEVAAWSAHLRRAEERLARDDQT